jgi:MoaA/NifB/PqqE/SkfB family radical SAM enzyme
MTAMPFLETVSKAILARGIARCLTGDAGDLEKLLRLYRLTGDNPTVNAFLKKLSSDMNDGMGVANLLLHVGKHANRTQKRRLIENLALNWMAKGRSKRLALRTQDQWVPFFVVISPTMRCNLRCTGCYSALYSKDGELSEGEMDRILTECKEIGCHFVVLSGGEPYLMKDSLLRLFRKHSDIFFLTFTNATLLDEALVKRLAGLGNVSPAISVEGYQEHTDQRRSKGVYESAMRAMDCLRKVGVVFGISVTYTRENVELVTDDRFVEFYVGKGAMFAWYFMFMPVGKDPILELVPTPEQRVFCGQRVVQLAAISAAAGGGAECDPRSGDRLASRDLFCQDFLQLCSNGFGVGVAVQFAKHGGIGLQRIEHEPAVGAILGFHCLDGLLVEWFRKIVATLFPVQVRQIGETNRHSFGILRCNLPLQTTQIQSFGFRIPSARNIAFGEVGHRCPVIPDGQDLL